MKKYKLTEAYIPTVHTEQLCESFYDWESETDVMHMTEEEEKLQKVITNILINKSGKYGPYQHGVYAKRLQDYVLKIVPLSVTGKEPFTACIQIERGIIFIGEGFLVDQSKLYQLNVIIRHEMAHQLLRHNIRILAKLGDRLGSRLNRSMSLQHLLNEIEDFEISNRKYTSEDKAIIQNLYLNGKEIQGLVTELHREAWMKLSLEEMYDKLVEELKRMNADFRRGFDSFRWTPSGGKLSRGDQITASAFQSYKLYKDENAKSIIWRPIEEYFATSKQFANIAKTWQTYIKQVYEAVKDYDTEKLEALLDTIIDSDIIEPVDIADGVDAVVPEEKFWASQVVKTLLGLCRDKPPKVKITRAEHSPEYKSAYNTVIDACGTRAKCSDEELEELGKLFSRTTDKGDM